MSNDELKEKFFMKKCMVDFGLVIISIVVMVGCNDKKNSNVDSSSSAKTNFNKCPYNVEEIENDYKDTYRLWCVSVRNGVNSWDEVADLEKVTGFFYQIDNRGNKILKHSDCQTEAIRLRNFVNPLKAEIQRFNNSNTKASFPCRAIFGYSDTSQSNNDNLYSGCERNCIYLNTQCNSAGLLGSNKDCSAEYDNCLSRCRN